MVDLPPSISQQKVDTLDSWENKDICEENLEGEVGGDESVPDSQRSVESFFTDKVDTKDSNSDFEDMIRKLFPGTYSCVEAEPNS